jgi:hypothetical protein
MRAMELEALLRGRCLLAVENVGRGWAREEREVEEAKEVKEIKEKHGTRQLTEEVGGFGEDNMKECITKLARE